MKLSVKGLALATGILWAAYILIIGLVEMVVPGYGDEFLKFSASLYPGYTYNSTVGSILVGTVLGFVDGAIGGAVFAWIYNKLS